jgi:hypothetical protein
MLIDECVGIFADPRGRTGRRPDTVKVYNFLTNFRDVGPHWVSFPQQFKISNYTTLGSGKIYHTNCAPKHWTCDECTVAFSENQPPNQDQPYSWSQDKTYVTPCQEYCPPEIANASVPTDKCAPTVLGRWLSPLHPNDVFVLQNGAGSDDEVMLNTSGCHDCRFSSAKGRITSTGVQIILSFDTKSEQDLVVGTLHNHSCALLWTTNSTSASGHWGTWWRHNAEPAPTFSSHTRGYAACGDPAPFEEFNDYNSTTSALANLQYAVGKGKPFFIAMGVFKPHYPWHVPQKFADLYEQDAIALPNITALHAPLGVSPWAWDLGLDSLTSFRILNDSAPGGSWEVPVNGPNTTMPRWAFQSMRKGYYSAVCAWNSGRTLL